MRYWGNRIELTENEHGQVIEENNFIEYDGAVYYLKYLNNDIKGSKGGNSSVFILYTKEADNKEKVIKISNYFRPHRHTPEHIRRRFGRFINEIKVLNDLKEKEKTNIIEIYFNGEIEIEGRIFPYYVMEKADTDLKEYMLAKKDVDSQEKVKFCINVFDAVKELHIEGYYHRDIKPDNIFLFYEDGDEKEKLVWKIGDLGLVADRDKDYDDLGEKIGPFGWLSPEAMNKYLTEKAGLGFDCKIDEKSDIFQLGKLFWFIFQGNVPIGQIRFDDFICQVEHKEILFELINEMLHYSKPRRISADGLEPFVVDLKLAFAV
ncbi:MAG: protein kinase [Bacteroidetes bacterium]|nr:protein kinase [Bacteroidota bacterium]